MCKRLLFLTALASILGFSFAAQANPGVYRTIAQAAPSKVLKDTVKKIREDDEGVVVLFVKTTGSFYLRRTNGNFDALKKKLDESLKTKAEISVTYDSTELNILEVK